MRGLNLMNDFAPDLENLLKEPVHSLSEQELDALSDEYIRIKSLVDSGEYELTIEDQRTVLQWRRADRETKFILNQIKVKGKKEKAVRVKKPKKLSQKALGLLFLKELNGEVLTEDENRNKHFTMTGEI